MITKTYTAGTHRARAPEATFEVIRPHLRALGVTRCADVTGLDCLGIPTYCAIRPEGVVLQVTNGKGLRHIDAKVSALMEAIELFHAESPACALRRSSTRAMVAAGLPAVHPDRIQEFRPERRYSDDRIIDWVEGYDLVDGSPVWLPAPAVYVVPPMLFDWSSNGLASGNNRVEASLHAILEVIERHALSGLCVDEDVAFDHCEVVDLGTITDEATNHLVEQIRRAGLKLVLLRVPTGIPAHTFMAILLDPEPFGHASRLSMGYGAHLSPAVAATRAITESAQTRLTYIHGARNDLRDTLYRGRAGRARIYEFFDALEPDASWEAFEDHASSDLESDHRHVVEALRAAGHAGIHEVELTRPGLPIAVVRVFVEGTLRTFPL